jgi:hypothetical protein
MKKIMIGSLLALLMMGSSPVFAKDANKSVLCLAGMLQGAGKVSGCKSAIKDYFKIVKFKRRHHKWRYDPNGTKAARGAFLDGASANDGWGKKINNKYGKIFSM